MREITQTRLSRPATPPMNLDAGKPEAREAFFNSGLTLVFLLFAAIGAWLASLFGAHQGESLIPGDYDFIGVPRGIGFAFGWALALFAVQNAFTYSKLTRLGWVSYYRRLDDWHNMILSAYEDTGGQETLEQLSIYEINPKVPSNVLSLALAVHQRVTHSPSMRRAAYSVRGLEGSHFLKGPRGNLVLVGTLTGTRPEELNKLFVALGLIRDQRPGVAGEWAPSSELEVLQLITSNWPKLGRAYTGETVKLGDNDE